MAALHLNLHRVPLAAGLEAVPGRRLPGMAALRPDQRAGMLVWAGREGLVVVDLDFDIERAAVHSLTRHDPHSHAAVAFSVTLNSNRSVKSR